MDLDFPLILVCATLGSGAIWLLDIFLLAPRRQAAFEAQSATGTVTVDAAPAEPAIVEYSKSFFPVLAVVLVLRSFLYEPFQIPSGSMLPTLQVGDFILVNKFNYGLRLPVAGTKVVAVGDPQRGDVMVFKFPNNPKLNYIKRVVGLPGDLIVYTNKQLTINGDPMAQELVAQLPPGEPKIQLLNEQLGEVNHQIYKNINRASGAGQWVVPEGHYFVMGDNRDNSNDSRFWKFVPDKLVVGEAVVVWMHWENFFSLPGFAHVGAID